MEVRGDKWGGQAMQSAIVGDDTIVVGGGRRLEDGQKVKVIKKLKIKEIKKDESDAFSENEGKMKS